ncbi:Hypothetical predicted protein [Olea europaea subsp. europaea]|uniref:Uncharacterized protein n=1 Tax=Olea europaea subsp. europaea TaxID=158383 RepID=A0A8S0RY52_OLEEU|nr:Hypothetical predicted protein [Olea europaea subsp. europaea]
MGGWNVGICHSCRSTKHSFIDCRVKRQCPWCALGLQMCFEVERTTSNKGRLFRTCSSKCGYFDWVVNKEGSGESSTINEAFHPPAIEEVDDLPSMFDSLARIAEKQDIEISLNVTFRKGKRSEDMNGKREAHD